MYALIDTFNNVVLSTHHTVEAAEAAHDKLQSRVQSANGSGAYIPTKIADATGLKKGDRLSAEEVAAAERIVLPWE